MEKESQNYEEIQINHDSLHESINYEKTINSKQDFWSKFCRTESPDFTFQKDFIFISDKNESDFLKLVQNLCFLLPENL